LRESDHHGSNSEHGHGGCCGHGCSDHDHANGHANVHSHGHGHAHGHQAVHQQDLATAGEPTIIGTLANSVGWLDAHDPAECASQTHDARDCEQARCDHSELNMSTNIIVLVRANELITMSRVNTLLAITAVLYIAVNVVCTILNSYDNDCDPAAPGCSPASSPRTFHNLEFWSTFIFNTADLLAVSYSPRTLSNQYNNPALLKLIVLFNVGFAFVSCLLVSINLEKFEVLSHELEYANEITVTIFDAMILLSLCRGRTHERGRCDTETCASSVIFLAVAMVAAVQLGVYNLSGWTEDGDSKGEQAAHYLEFTFGAFSAGVTFWFTMDNKLCAEKRLRQIMHGREQRHRAMV